MTLLSDVAGIDVARVAEVGSATKSLKNIHRVELFVTCCRYWGTWLHVQPHSTSVAEQLRGCQAASARRNRRCRRGLTFHIPWRIELVNHLFDLKWQSLLN